MHDLGKHGRAVAAPITSLALRALQSWDGFLELVPIAILVCDRDGVLVQYNRCAAELWGRSPVPGDCTICFDGAWKTRRLDGTALPGDQTPMAEALRMRAPLRNQEYALMRPDGSQAIVLANLDPLFDAEGEFAGAVSCLQDITERRSAEAWQKQLLDELNHRVKNALATVQSLAHQTFRGAGIPADACKAFEGRLLVLSKTHDQLARQGWDAALLPSIVSEVMAPYQNSEGGRVATAGIPIRLRPKTALTVAMVLHELASNAERHGALSQPAGTITISWHLVDRNLKIRWRESGGPSVLAPARRGFGVRLIERAVTQELNGIVNLVFEPEGVHCEMEFPISVGS